jgi:hypothetical protein
MAINRRFEQDGNGLLDEADFPGAATTTNNFDPARHIVRLRGGDYLEVKWRLLWLRQSHPDALIETELVHFDPENKMAVFKAHIAIPNAGSATGWGSETSDDFKDFIEKAETKAIGRACAALGFGTQHCQDFDYDSKGEGRVVDAPVSYPSSNGGYRSAPASTGNGGGFVSAAGNSGSLATEKQVKFIYATGRDQGLSDEQIVARCKEKIGLTPEELTKSSASRFIDMLKQPA